jgi:hypothetical protein
LQYVGPAVDSSVNFKMTREAEQGVQIFNHRAIPLPGGDLAPFQFGNWTATSQGIPLVTSHNGQQSRQTLANQWIEPDLLFGDKAGRTPVSSSCVCQGRSATITPSAEPVDSDTPVAPRPS